MICRSCHQPIVWAMTPAGKQMPVDATPSMEGNVVLTVADDDQRLAEVLVGERLEDARLVNVALRTSHFVTCPDAGAWRNR